MHKEDLALNNLLWLICFKNQPNQTIVGYLTPNPIYTYILNK